MEKFLHSIFDENLAIILDFSLCLMALIQCISKSYCFKPKSLLNLLPLLCLPCMASVQALHSPHLDYSNLSCSISASDSIIGSMCNLKY